MTILALVTLLIVLQYFTFAMLCGMARVKSGIEAPAMSGDPLFERALRVQMNTLEQLVMVLPLLWLSGYYFRADIAAACGVAFIIGRFIYRATYMSDPKKRGPGMMIGMFASLVLMATAAWGIVSQLI